jgi:hypothetical protein
VRSTRTSLFLSTILTDLYLSGGSRCRFYCGGFCTLSPSCHHRRMQNQECTPTDTAQLASQAWAAYDQNRPARVSPKLKRWNLRIRIMQIFAPCRMRSHGHAAGPRDARGLLDQRLRVTMKEVSKAAEIVLLKVLRLDPTPTMRRSCSIHASPRRYRTLHPQLS